MIIHEARCQELLNKTTKARARLFRCQKKENQQLWITIIAHYMTSISNEIKKGTFVDAISWQSKMAGMIVDVKEGMRRRAMKRYYDKNKVE